MRRKHEERLEKNSNYTRVTEISSFSLKIEKYFILIQGDLKLLFVKYTYIYMYTYIYLSLGLLLRLQKCVMKLPMKFHV